MHRARSTILGVAIAVIAVAGTSAALAGSGRYESLGQGYGYGYCGADGELAYQYSHSYQYDCPPPATPVPGTDPVAPNPGPQPPTQPAPADPNPPVVPPKQLSTKAPIAPSTRAIQVVGGAKATRFAAVIAKGVAVTFPAREAGVSVRGRLTVKAATARALGLRVPRGMRIVEIGGGSLVTRKAGAVVVKMPINAAARAALRRARAPRTIDATLMLTLTKNGQAASVTKSIGLRR